jgi:hypothetical protein
VVLQALTLVAVIIGLYLTIRQLKLLTQTHVNNHDWNRRRAAVEAIDVSVLANDLPLLDEKFKIMSQGDPIPLDKIIQECNASAAVRAAVHRRLNYLEVLALGVIHRVFDEDIVKASQKTTFQRTVRQFGNYINHRRTAGMTGVWKDLEDVDDRWREGPATPREPTG